MNPGSPASSGRTAGPAPARYESFLLRWGRRFLRESLTQAGRWFLVPTIAAFLFGSITLESQAFVLAAYAAALWGVAFVAGRIWRPRVRLAARHAERICAGETLPVDVEVEQTGRLAGHDLFVRPLALPAGASCLPRDGAPLPALRRGETAHARVGIVCARRGAYHLEGFGVETDLPFGIYRTYARFRAERPLLVYPSFSPLTRLVIPTGRRYQPGGVALASVVGEASEYIGNREYRDGDSPRDIDWRATARLQRPIVREYREEYFLRVAVVLDTHVPARSPATRRDDLERAVSVCAAVGDYLARQEYVVDIFAAGPNLYHLMAGRSLAYLDQILDILACVEESHVEPFGAIEPELVENLACLSAVVCIFLDWTASRRAFVENLRRQGVGTKVVVVNARRPTEDPAADAGWLGGPVPVLDAATPAAAVEEL